MESRVVVEKSMAILCMIANSMNKLIRGFDGVL